MPNIELLKLAFGATYYRCSNASKIIMLFAIENGEMDVWKSIR